MKQTSEMNLHVQVQDVKFSKNCPCCNIEIIFNNKYNLQRSLKNNSCCRSCNRTELNLFQDKAKDKNGQWKGYKEIPYSWFSKYFERKNPRKRRRGNISIEEVYNLYIKQDKKCKLSGLNIGFYDDGNKHTCSIDRIDSLKEYTLDNIQLVHKDVNFMKNRFSNNYFIKICNMISENNKGGEDQDE